MLECRARGLRSLCYKNGHFMEASVKISSYDEGDKCFNVLDELLSRDKTRRHRRPEAKGFAELPVEPRKQCFPKMRTQLNG